MVVGLLGNLGEEGFFLRYGPSSVLDGLEGGVPLLGAELFFVEVDEGSSRGVRARAFATVVHAGDEAPAGRGAVGVGVVVLLRMIPSAASLSIWGVVTIFWPLWLSMPSPRSSARMRMTLGRSLVAGGVAMAGSTSARVRALARRCLVTTGESVLGYAVVTILGFRRACVGSLDLEKGDELMLIRHLLWCFGHSICSVQAVRVVPSQFQGERGEYFLIPRYPAPY